MKQINYVANYKCFGGMKSAYIHNIYICICILRPTSNRSDPNRTKQYQMMYGLLWCFYRNCEGVYDY